MPIHSPVSGFAPGNIPGYIPGIPALVAATFLLPPSSSELEFEELDESDELVDEDFFFLCFFLCESLNMLSLELIDVMLSDRSFDERACFIISLSLFLFTFTLSFSNSSSCADLYFEIILLRKSKLDSFPSSSFFFFLSLLSLSSAEFFN
jgi:hypothetical protein